MKRILTILALLMLGGCSSHTAQISVDGTAKTGVVTYMVDGEQSQTEQMIPWGRDFTVSPGSIISASVQNQSDTGSLNISIKVDGRTVKTGSTNAPYGVASAAYSLDPPNYLPWAVGIGIGLALLGGAGAAQKKTEDPGEPKPSPQHLPGWVTAAVGIGSLLFCLYIGLLVMGVV